MKKSLKNTVTVVLAFSFFSTLQAQNSTNIISCEEYSEISFNGSTIEHINATNGDPQQLKQLFGSYSSVEKDGAVLSRTFYYGNNSIHFRYELGYVNGYVTNLTVSDIQWPVVIQENTVRIGDSVTDLTQQFGESLIIGQSEYGQGPFIGFGCFGIDEGVDLDIDPVTNTVQEIVYFVSS